MFEKSFLFAAPLHALVLVALGTGSCPAAEAKKPIHALLVTGGCCHDYEHQKEIISKSVSARANVEWTIVQEGGSGTKHVPYEQSIYQNPDWAKGYDIGPGARGYAFNADLVTMIDFLDIGTRVIQDRVETS